MDTVAEKITIDALEYHRLVEICCAADVFVRSESHDALEALRDAILVRTGLID